MQCRCYPVVFDNYNVVIAGEEYRAIFRCGNGLWHRRKLQVSTTVKATITFPVFNNLLLFLYFLRESVVFNGGLFQQVIHAAADQPHRSFGPD